MNDNKKNFRETLKHIITMADFRRGKAFRIIPDVRLNKESILL